MNFAKEEIEYEKQMTTAEKIILPILFLTFIAGYFMVNSKSYIDRKYHEFQNYSFSGEIYKKEEDQSGTGCNIARYFHLKTGIIHRVDCYIYAEYENW